MPQKADEAGKQPWVGEDGSTAAHRAPRGRVLAQMQGLRKVSLQLSAFCYHSCDWQQGSLD